ncbi:MFS transporter [Legionella qingyii]|uniref:MFS transporter n=1 Tax=Legionella qingyii TaxID=2184757 RepID=UPI000F8F049E|nr:MFS transporter [Legionella qingyii]RUR24268.1 MFS transporter [Legionella qingyii]
MDILNDRFILYSTAFLRALALGMIGVLLAIYLAKIQFSPNEIGYVISIGLVGGTTAALIVTFFGDYFGRRRLLIVIALLSALGGIIIVFATNIIIVSIAAFIGILNGMGRDRGASLILEQAILPSTTSDADRTGAFAWYSILQDIGIATGGLIASVPTLLYRVGHINLLLSFRITIIIYSSLMLVTAFLYLKLSPNVEVSIKQVKLTISKQSKKILWKISALFTVDSVSGGFLGAALLSFFFYERFHVSVGIIAVLFFFGRILNSLSYLGATWLSKHIGLVNTMVFTHIPSSLILIVIAMMPSTVFWIAALLFLLREALVEMDVPTRESYVMAVIRPEERTFASGITHLVRLGGWSVAPAFAGVLMQYIGVSTPLIIGAVMKIGYDLLLYLGFRKIKPPEET